MQEYILVSKTEFKRKIKKYMAMAKNKTIAITYKRNPTWVLISAEEYGRLNGYAATR